MGQIFFCCIIQGVSYNYHQRNVRFRVSVSVSNLWQSFGLVSKFEPGLGLGGYGLDYITVTNAHRGDWTGLNFAYTVIEIRIKKYKATIIESSKAKHSTVNSLKGFVLLSSQQNYLRIHYNLFA